MSEALEREEEKAREVIRGKMGEVGYGGAVEKRVVEKDDESDEFYDRTIKAKTQEVEQKAESYESLREQISKISDELK